MLLRSGADTDVVSAVVVSPEAGVISTALQYRTHSDRRSWEATARPSAIFSSPWLAPARVNYVHCVRVRVRTGDVPRSERLNAA